MSPKRTNSRLGPLHKLFPGPGTLFSQSFHGKLLTVIQILSKHRFLHGAAPEPASEAGSPFPGTTSHSAVLEITWKLLHNLIFITIWNSITSVLTCFLSPPPRSSAPHPNRKWALRELGPCVLVSAIPSTSRRSANCYWMCTYMHKCISGGLFSCITQG